MRPNLSERARRYLETLGAPPEALEASAALGRRVAALLLMADDLDAAYAAARA